MIDKHVYVTERELRRRDNRHFFGLVMVACIVGLIFGPMLYSIRVDEQIRRQGCELEGGEMTPKGCVVKERAK